MLRAVFLFFVLAGIWGTPASAGAQSLLEAVAGVKFCKSLKDDAMRLKCFDGIELGQVEPGSPEPKKETEWSVTESKSPLDDSPEVLAVLAASEGAGSLVLRCKEKKSEAMFSPGRFSFLGSSEQIKVLARIDEGKLIQTRWSPSTSGNGAFAPSPIQFMRSLPDDGKLFLRAFSYNGTPSDSTFALGKVSSVRDKIGAACQWPR